jgi:hypothetical protein
MQDVVNDPIKLLQAVINQQVADGNTVAFNIASQAKITFFKNPNSHLATNDPTINVSVVDGSGDLGNIPFLEGGEPVGPKGPNAETALVYATFWVEKVKRGILTFKQLQYAQMVLLNFEVLNQLPTNINVSWPHISVATLRQGFI